MTLRKTTVAALTAAVFCGSLAFAILSRKAADRSRDTRDAGVARVPKEMLCGPITLGIALARLGVPVTMETIVAESKVTAKGASFGQLRDVAQKHAVNAVCRILDWGRLRCLSGTAVLFAGGNHFVAVDPREKDPDRPEERIRLYDVDKLARWVTRSELEGMWKGESLTLERRPVNGVANSAKAWLDTCWSDIGWLNSDGTARWSFRVKNMGTVPLRAEIAYSSCGCSTRKLDKNPIAPEENGLLEVAVDLQDMRGQFWERIMLKTNDPEAPEIWIVMCAGTRNVKLSSVDKLYFGEILPGQKSVRKFYVHDPGEGKLEVAGFEVSMTEGPPNVTPSVEFKRASSGFAEPSVKSRFQVKDGDYLFEVAFQLNEPAVPGKIAGAISVPTNLTGQWSNCTVPFDAMIGSDIRATPGAVLLSCKKEAGKAAFRLDRRSGKPLGLTGVRIAGEVPVGVDYHVNENGTGATVDVFVAGDARLTASKEGQIVCECKGGTVKIPVMVLKTD